MYSGVYNRLEMSLVNSDPTESSDKSVSVSLVKGDSNTGRVIPSETQPELDLPKSYVNLLKLW